MKEKTNNYFNLCITIITTAIAIASLLVSIISFRLSDKIVPLNYDINPTITSSSNNTLKIDYEIIVSDGAVGNMRFFTYNNDQIQENDNNKLGIIKKHSSKSKRTATFELGYSENNPEQFLASQYVLINGKDGSKHLDMFLFHFDTKSKSIIYEYLSEEDVFFASKTAKKNIYQSAFDNYEKIREKLVDRNML